MGCYATAEMMHKDIALGIALGQKLGVPQPMHEFVIGKYVTVCSTMTSQWTIMTSQCTYHDVTVRAS